MFWILSVVEMYLMWGFVYDLVVFPELMTWLHYWSVCDIPLWCFMLRYSMHV